MPCARSLAKTEGDDRSRHAQEPPLNRRTSLRRLCITAYLGGALETLRPPFNGEGALRELREQDRGPNSGGTDTSFPSGNRRLVGLKKYGECLLGVALGLPPALQATPRSPQGHETDDYAPAHCTVARPFMRYRIIKTNTLRSVKDKNTERYDEECADFARKELKKFVDQFPTQTAAAKVLDINQGTLSRMLTGELQPNMKVLLCVARQTRRTIDEVLGLTRDVVSIESRIRDSQLQRVAEVVAARVAERLKSDPPPPLSGSGPAIPPPPPLQSLPPALPPAGRPRRRRGK